MLPSDERTGAVRLADGEFLRPFDPRKEDPGRLIRLKETVYGEVVRRDSFAWEYYGHPRAAEIRVFVRESQGQIIASTTRLPATLFLHGEPCPVYFNCESMVHPAHRRRGHMRELYKLARLSIPGSPIYISKGSSESIYPMLHTVGHQVIRPNTFLVHHPSALRWLLSTLRLVPPPGPVRRRPPRPFPDFVPVERFGPEHDQFFERVSRKFPAVMQRDSAFMNWRYVDIPHRSYTAFARVSGSDVESLVVLGMQGHKGLVVDALWDPERKDDADRLVRFSQAWLAENGAATVVCFASHIGLRDVLRARGFADRGDTPRFSAFIPQERKAAFERARQLHLVDGDGDTDFS